MQVWSHRGLVGPAVENTLASFDAALDAGASGIECDVRLCGSGEPVVLHDPTLWRTDRKFLPVATTSLNLLRASCSYQIPTLAEIIERYADNCQVVLDLKGSRLRSAALEKAVSKSVKKSQVIVSSTNVISLCKMASLLPKVELALINESWLSPSRLSPTLLAFNSIHFSDRLASKSRIRFWKQHGFNVRVWTVNGVERANRLARFGADAIFTDSYKLMSRSSNETIWTGTQTT